MCGFDRFIFSVVVVSLLVGCGGGGSGGINLSETGESVTIRSTIEQLAGSADSLLLSDVVGTFKENPRPTPPGAFQPELGFFDPRPFRAEPTCRTTTSCSVTVLGQSIPISLSTLQSLDPNLQFTDFGNRQGVSMAEGQSHTTQQGVSTSVSVLGGWLDHNFFAVQLERVTGGLTDIEAGYSYSVGAASGTTPLSGSATWIGVVVGGDISNTANKGNRIQGDATLTFDLANVDLDIAFTSIRDLDAGGLHSNMTWSDVPVTSGQFGTGSTGDSIEGQFYGQNHEEVGGIFERNQILGAFGANRQ